MTDAAQTSSTTPTGASATPHYHRVKESKEVPHGVQDSRGPTRVNSLLFKTLDGAAFLCLFTGEQIVLHSPAPEHS